MNSGGKERRGEKEVLKLGRQFEPDPLGGNLKVTGATQRLQTHRVGAEA